MRLFFIRFELAAERQRSQAETCLYLNCSALRLFNLIMRLHFIEPGCGVPLRMKLSHWSAGKAVSSAGQQDRRWPAAVSQVMGSQLCPAARVLFYQRHLWSHIIIKGSFPSISSKESFNLPHTDQFSTKNPALRTLSANLSSLVCIQGSLWFLFSTLSALDR